MSNKKLQEIKSSLSSDGLLDSDSTGELLKLCEEQQLRIQSLSTELDYVNGELDCLKATLGTTNVMTLNKKAKDLCESAKDIQTQNKALKSFASTMLRMTSQTIDTDQIQEIAVDCGLLTPFEATEPCSENCMCAKTGFPSMCLRMV